MKIEIDDYKNLLLQLKSILTVIIDYDSINSIEVLVKIRLCIKSMISILDKIADYNDFNNENRN